MSFAIGHDREGVHAARSFKVAACALALASCATVTRIPYTQQEQKANADGCKKKLMSAVYNFVQ